MNNTQEIILRNSKKILEFLIPSSGAVTITSKKGIALVRRQSKRRKDKGDAVSPEENFVINCKKGDIIIIELIGNHELFIGNITRPC